MNALDKDKIKIPVMRDLTEHLNFALQHGYDQNFQVVGEQLQSIESSKFYAPEDLQIVNFYRYEGISDPDDNSILYIIETREGAKGTLVDAYGAYSNPDVEEFMKRVSIEGKN